MNLDLGFSFPLNRELIKNKFLFFFKKNSAFTLISK